MVESIQKPGLNIDFYTNFLTKEEADSLYIKALQSIPGKLPNLKRANTTFGDDGLEYEVTFGGYGNVPKNTVHRKTRPWNQLPGLWNAKEKVEEATGEVYNFCVVQYYPCGKVGINPHRDREMVPGTTIAGLSLGTTRTLRMSRFDDMVELELNHNSLYVLNPPTNDKWMHSIPKDTTTKARISLTFRNVPPA